MRIGGLGIICFTISLLAICGKDYLLYCMIFFAPFCASSVVSFNSFFLQPGHYFLFIYLFHLAYKCFLWKKWAKKGKSNKTLLFFVIWAGTTILLSALFEIDIPVYGIGNDNQLKSSLVSIQNLTQYLYLVLGFIAYKVINNYCLKNSENWKKVVKIFGFSGFAVLLIGLYQLIAYRFGLPYDEIFRNDVKEMWQIKERVQSTFGEASFLGQYCVYLIAIYFGYEWTDNKYVRGICWVLVIIIGVLSRSSGFLFGIVAVFVSIVLLNRLSTKNVVKYITVALLVIIGIPYAVNHFAGVQKLLSSTIAKLTLESWSGIERTTIFQYMFRIGLKYPLFGIGYGGGRSTDLYANILSNTGIIGFCLLFFFIFNDFFKVIRVRKQEGAVMCILLLVGFLVTSASVPDISYLPVWLLFAIVDSYVELYGDCT